MTRIFSALACCLLTGALLGCGGMLEESWRADTEYTGTTATIQDPGGVKYHRSDEMVRLGVEYFNRGDYGTAERHFRDAVEKAPGDVVAWIGLAASYDRIGRFDLADKAYYAAIRLAGETPQILNNVGYSLMLRGDLAQARAKFTLAIARAPGNLTILNNIELLDASYSFIQRKPETPR